MGPADLLTCKQQMEKMQMLCTVFQKHSEITQCQGESCLRDHHMESLLSSRVHHDLGTVTSSHCSRAQIH